MENEISRRSFLSRSASYATMLGVIPLLGTCESCHVTLAARPIRKSLATLDPNDPIIQTYRDAVAQMKALPGTDKRNWQNQALIHSDFCPHSNWYFLPWHRAYLNYFENICRQLTGDNSFALPYWDWTVDPHVPAPFWGGGSTNALFNANRFVSNTSEADSGMVGRPEIDSILGETDFFLFGSNAATAQRTFAGYGRLEGTPHNHIHGFVGGDMGNYMSPLDPVFWMHHNMIECLWVEWNIVRGNANPSDAQWTQFVFPGNFCDRMGTQVDISVATTALLPILSYQFDGACGGAGGEARMAAATRDTSSLREFLRHGGPPRVQIKQRFPIERGLQLSTRAPVSVAIPLERAAVAAVVERGGTDRMLLRINGVNHPKSESFFVRVFVNLPTASTETSITDAHYAGSFAFFSDTRHTPDNAAGFVVDLSDTLRRLQRAERLGANAQLQFVAVPVHAGAAAVPDSFAATSLSLELAQVMDKH
jgi:tyrosinase